MVVRAQTPEKFANGSRICWNGAAERVFGALLLLWVGQCTAQTAGEYEVKAAFLYKFANFIEWPGEPAKSPMCIAVLGKDPFGAALDEVVKGKLVNGRGFQVRRPKSAQDASGCQIVFIGDSERNRLRSTLDRFQGSSIVTVSDIPGFCEEGGMIEFELRDQKVHFYINPEAGERVRLKFSSQLLSVAHLVKGRRLQ